MRCEKLHSRNPQSGGVGMLERERRSIRGEQGGRAYGRGCGWGSRATGRRGFNCRVSYHVLGNTGGFNCRAEGDSTAEQTGIQLPSGLLGSHIGLKWSDPRDYQMLKTVEMKKMGQNECLPAIQWSLFSFTLFYFEFTFILYCLFDSESVIVTFSNGPHTIIIVPNHFLLSWAHFYFLIIKLVWRWYFQRFSMIRTYSLLCLLILIHFGFTFICILFTLIPCCISNAFSMVRTHS